MGLKHNVKVTHTWMAEVGPDLGYDMINNASKSKNTS